jgi:hypothetical protein
VKKSRITIIVLFTVLGILLLLYFIFNDKEKRYQWNESYDAESDQPYGTLFIKKLLEDFRPSGHLTFNDKKPVQHLLDSLTLTRNTDYVFIGQEIYLDELDKKALVSFIRNGNDVFISSLSYPAEIIKEIYSSECDHEIYYQSNRAPEATLNFYHDTLRREQGYSYAFRYGAEDVGYFWQSLDKTAFCDSTKSLIPLGYQDPERVNFFKLKYGKGNLYIHTNPLVFTNYFILKSDKLEYASAVFSHLSGKNIIWDEYSKVPFMRNENKYDSPLYYILQQPSLKYAWWLLLTGIVLYVLFAAKRTQRIIPVLEAKSNTSLEYVQLISTLHFQNGNHLDMARKKMKYFLYFIRSKYGIHTQKNFTDEQLKKLAEKSKVNLSDVKKIFEKFHLIDKYSYSNIEPDKLDDLYKAIEVFYQNCK